MTPQLVMPGSGQVKQLPYDKPKPGGPPAPPMAQQPGGGNPKDAMVQALKAIRSAADQQGLNFDDLLKEAQVGPAAPQPIAPLPTL